MLTVSDSLHYSATVRHELSEKKGLNRIERFTSSAPALFKRWPRIEKIPKPPLNDNATERTIRFV